MPVNLAVTSQGLAGGVSESHAEQGLRVAVVRLLGVALNISGGRMSAPPAVALAMPSGYRDWPSLTSTVGSKTHGKRIRLYVCPNALLTADDASFPVGTVFVVESEPWPRMAKKVSGPPSLFVMEKYAGVSVNGAAAGRHESWIHANYGSDGRLMAADPMHCGVCRLPLMRSIADR